MTPFQLEFSQHLNKFSTNPYLFIGSGLSRRYLKIPTWLELLKTLFPKLQLKKSFEYYQSMSSGSLPKLATIIAKDFHEIWWESKDFENSRDLYKDIASQGTELPFKIEISLLVKSFTNEDETLKQELDFLKDSIIDGIITTNWDLSLNDLFSDYTSYIGQHQLLFTDCYNVGEIYKIHGCCSDFSSLIVTEADYENFNARNPYLAAKLLTFFIEHPIIFLGYSISDPNIIEILNSIIKCVDKNNIGKLKDRLIFVEWSRSGSETIIRDGVIQLESGVVLPIKQISAPSFVEIFEVLSTIKQRLPIKVLQKLKDRIFDFIKTNEPTNKIYVGDLSTMKDVEDIEFVVGVGISQTLFSEQGYKAHDVMTIIDNVLNERKDLNAKALVQHTIPRLISGNAYIPVFKFMKESGIVNKKGEYVDLEFSSDKLKEIFDCDKTKIYDPSHTYAKKRNFIRTKYKSIGDLIANESVAHSLVFIPLLKHEIIDLKELQNFLKDCFKDSAMQKNSNFKKLVCLYDYLKYGQSKPSVDKKLV